ncbi:testis-expressed protein 2 isoform X1 [Gadus macrocephalus]|uniref:testis-expressed protein 2 isoform X1 n=1 Tax=Gadus macrocephalus TaxID=80720 RepID=UPI0028CB392C|nr:testis-expressed protein 2 isoform X1 [Gadus macrocephalus]
MSESGKHGGGKREDQGGGRGGGGGQGLDPSHGPLPPDRRPSPPVTEGPTPRQPAHRRHLPRGIVIQLTGTEGKWDSLDDGELLFSGLHPDDEDPCPLISLSTEGEASPEEGEREPCSMAFPFPLSPSSPDSLGSCSPSFATPAPGLSSFLSPGPPSPTHRPAPAGLVKSLSTELELKEGSTLRPRPLLTLVKSISTELSRSEPEVSQSKSDSRLNLHLLKQLTQHKGRSGGCGRDSRTAPPSPGSLSPSGEGPRGSFFKLELEDTKKKLSEAMQEPLSSMFSKMRRDESSGSPKHQWRAPQGAGPSPGRAEGTTDPGASQESPLRSAKRADTMDLPPAFDWPGVRHPRRGRHGACPVHHHRRHPVSRPNHRDEGLEVYADDDTVRVIGVENQRREPSAPAGSQPSFSAAIRTDPPAPVPAMSLLCVAVLSYLYFTLPLGPYLSGAGLGLALGFLLGLFLLSLGSSRCRRPPPTGRRKTSLLGLEMGAGNVVASTEPDVLKGWMNEMQEYDPETSHPSLMASVFASLEGSSLCLESPRWNISRWARYEDDTPHAGSFVRRRTFHLVNSRVSLLPSVLARKRAWNPKYPICIQLAEGASSLGGGEAVSPEPQESQGLGEPDPVDPGTPNRQPGHGSQPAPHPPTTLYLFGRTGREKEEWFHQFLSASLDGAGRERDRWKKRGDGRPVNRADDLSTLQSLSPPSQGRVSCGASRQGSAEEDEAPSSPPVQQQHHQHLHHPTPPVSAPGPQTSSGSIGGLSLLDYPSYMARLLASAERLSPLPSPTAGGSAETSPTAVGDRCTCDLPESPAWANALVGRIFWDFLRERLWSDAMSRKIQKKLSRIHLPYFMNELTLTELDMGSCMPQITAASGPEVNHRGLWLELEVVYTGALQMTLQTKFNLSKLGKEGSSEPCCPDMGLQGFRPILGVLADSDEESSSAGSSDEEELLLSEPQVAAGDRGGPHLTEGAPGGRKGRRILKFVDKIAKSKYFQKATENEFIKKKIEEMSNTPLLLTVEVQELSGTLVINIPPPPSDRIWYSFCMPPKLDLRVRPKLGEREVTFCHVTEWIERKLQQEFKKVFVLPNMDDIYVPLMHSGLDSPLVSQKLSPQSEQSPFYVDSMERDPAEITRAESH